MELAVTLTKHGHPARLIAVRASPEVAARRRRQKKDKRKRNGTRASKQALAREDWNILVTNIPAELCTAGELITLYRQRWEIEIHFRGWKQSLHMRKALQRITSQTHLHAMVLAAMIFSSLVVRSKRLIMQENPGMEISGEKLFGWLSGRLKLFRTLFSSIPFDPRHFCRCKRKRDTLKQKGRNFIPLNWRQWAMGLIQSEPEASIRFADELRQFLGLKARQSFLGNNSGTETFNALANDSNSVSQTHFTCPSIRAMTPRLTSQPWSWQTAESLDCDHPS
ncbi:MAG: transposase [Akkermansiaceae bacterium]|nr:transposase [Akkermansiaceae bacterium]